MRTPQLIEGSELMIVSSFGDAKHLMLEILTLNKQKENAEKKLKVDSSRFTTKPAPNS